LRTEGSTYPERGNEDSDLAGDARRSSGARSRPVVGQQTELGLTLLASPKPGGQRK